MSHAKEPWEIESGVGDYYILYDKKSVTTIGLIGEIENLNNNHVSRKTRFDNARRVVSCVNACATLKNPEKDIKALQEENAMLRQFVKDTSEGFECLETCDSHAHDELCPQTNPIQAWRELRNDIRELVLAARDCVDIPISEEDEFRLLRLEQSLTKFEGVK